MYLSSLFLGLLPGVLDSERDSSLSTQRNQDTVVSENDDYKKEIQGTVETSMSITSLFSFLL